MLAARLVGLRHCCGSRIACFCLPLEFKSLQYNLEYTVSPTLPSPPYSVISVRACMHVQHACTCMVDTAGIPHVIGLLAGPGRFVARAATPGGHVCRKEVSSNFWHTPCYVSSTCIHSTKQNKNVICEGNLKDGWGPVEKAFSIAQITLKCLSGFLRWAIADVVN